MLLQHFHDQNKEMFDNWGDRKERSLIVNQAEKQLRAIRRGMVTLLWVSLFGTALCVFADANSASSSSDFEFSLIFAYGMVMGLGAAALILLFLFSRNQPEKNKQ